MVESGRVIFFPRNQNIIYSTEAGASLGLMSCGQCSIGPPRKIAVKKFSLVWVHSLYVKNISFSSYSVYSNSSNLANSV